MSDQTAFVRFAGSKEAAHLAILAAYEQAKTLIELGGRVRVEVSEVEDELSIKQRKFFHGPLLGQIAEQVRMPDGTRYVAEIWKEHLKNLFIPDKWLSEKRLRVVTDKTTGEVKTVLRRVRMKKRKSTEDFGVKGYSNFIDQCIAYAATEWRVEFRFLADEREEVRYVAPARKPRQQAATQQEETHV